MNAINAINAINAMWTNPVLAEASSLSAKWGLPPQASTVAGPMDGLYWFVYYVSLFFFVLICTLLVVFVVKYRRRDPNYAPKGLTHHTGLEVTWTIIPLIIAMFIFYFGYKQFLVMATPPDGAWRVNLAAKQWSFEFNYPDVESINGENLHTWIGNPTLLEMESTDVIHAFWSPAMRVKRDITPGRYSYVWFEPTQVGEFHVFCAEFCGKDHSRMTAKLFVWENEDEARKKIFAEDKLTGTNWEKGLAMVMRKGCLQCHTVDDSVSTGPSWAETARLLKDKKERETTKGTVLVDRQYLMNSIKEPNEHIVNGFGPVMPRSSFRVEDRITYIVDFIEELSKDPTKVQQAVLNETK